MKWTVGAALLVVVACGSARADEFADENARAVRENPAGVVLRLSSPRPRYRVGERIPVVLAFEDTSGAPGRSVDITSDGPRVLDGQLGGDVVFRVAPDQGWADPLRVELAPGSGGSGVLGAVGERASVHGCRRELDLNEWVRFDRPGTYRVACQVAWIRQDRERAGATTSTIIELELVPADAAFEEETIARAREQLARPRPLDLNAEDYEDVCAARKEGARVLAFLATPAAVDTLLRATGDDLEGARRAGLVGARDRRAAVAAIEAAITDPHVPIDEVAAGAWELLTAPPPPAPLVPEAFEGEWTDETEALFREQGLQREEHREREARRARDFLARVVAALPDKLGDAFAPTCSLVVAGDVALPPAVRDLIASRLLTLPQQVQHDVLNAWPALRGSRWATPLKELVSARDVDPFGQGLALSCLHELDPAWVERFVLSAWPAEQDRVIRDPFGAERLDHHVLRLAPPGAIELDEAFVKLLFWTCRDHDVIERHGAPTLLARVRAFASDGPSCSLTSLCDALQRFWIRHDRAGGLAYTHAKHATIPQYIVAGIEWGPDVEALIGPPGDAWSDSWRTLELLAQRWGHDRLVAWWQALEAPRLREPLLVRLLWLGLGDDALKRVEAALRTPAEREAFDAFTRARRERGDSDER